METTTTQPPNSPALPVIFVLANYNDSENICLFGEQKEHQIISGSDKGKEFTV